MVGTGRGVIEGFEGMNSRSPIQSQSWRCLIVGLRAFSSATGMPVRQLILYQLSPRWTT
jgi:hypothetical protein